MHPKSQTLLVRIDRGVEKLALLVAILGGLGLVFIALITLANVVGRALIPFGLTSVRGQVELVQAGTAFAVCAFLPWAHLKRGHASVAIFTDMLGVRTNKIIDLVGDVVLFALAVLITWQHTLGMWDKQGFGETTFLLRLPLWWAYAACLIGLGAWIVVGLWTSLNSAQQLFVRPPIKLTGKAPKKQAGKR